MVDTDGQLFGGKAPKYEAVGGTDTGTGQHGEHGLRDHGHINHHQISHLHTVTRQNTRQPRYLDTGLYTPTSNHDQIQTESQCTM